MQLRSAANRASPADEDPALRREASLRRIATLVVGGVTAEELFSAVAREVSVVLDVPVVTVDRYELEGGAPVSVVLAAVEDARFPVGSRWPLDGPGARAWIYDTGRPVRIEDFSGLESTAAAAARAQGMRWVVGAPIVVDGAVWGNILAGTTGDEPIPDDAESRLADFTDLVSTAIANSDARERAGRLLDEQAALRRVATLVAEGASPVEIFSAVSDEVGGLFGSHQTVVGRFEPDGSGVTAVGASEGARGVSVGWRWPLEEFLASTRVYRTGRAARNEQGDWEEPPGPVANKLREMGFLSTVAAPIVVEGSLWGVMIVSDTRERLPVDTEERLARFTELVATAIANTQANEHVAQLAEEQAALRRVATLVAKGAAADDLFAAVAREVADLFGAGLVNLDRYENGEAVVLASFDDPGFPWPSIIASRRRMWKVGSRWPLGGPGLRTQVYETGRPVREDAAAFVAGSPPALARAWGTRSMVAAPIVVDGNVWGVLGIASKEDEPLLADTEQRLVAFTELVATAIANAESRGELSASEARARKLAEEQTALRRVATLVAGAPASEQFFSTVAREVASVLGVPGVIVTHYEADGTVVTFGEAFDSDLVGAERFLGVGTRMPLDPGSLAAQVFETHGTARIDDFSTLPGTIGELARAAGLGCGCAGPIVVNGDLWGKMCVFSPTGTVLPVGTENRLHDFIELVATAIANYEARAELAAAEARARELADEQAALRRVATLVARGVSPVEIFSAVSEEVGRLFGSEAAIARFEPDGSAMVVLGLTAGIPVVSIGDRWEHQDFLASTAVYRTGRPARYDQSDLQRASGPIADSLREMGIVSTVAAPIVVGGDLWGVITASEVHRPLPPDAEERLVSFTELVATAIANSEAREEITQLAEEQTALRRVATLVAEGATPNRVFDTVRHEVARMFDIPSTILMRFDADGMGTLLATYGDYLGPVGTRWPLEGDSSAVAMVHQTGRAARADYTRHVHGPLAQAARRGGVRYPVGVPVVVEGALWGAMSAGSFGPAPPPPDLEGRLAKFTELLATAIANAESRADLAASEARARELAREQAALRRVATLVAQGASPDELFSAVAKEVAGIIDIPVVAIHRYEADGTFTTLGVAGETSLTVGSRCGVKDGGIAGMILATGRPSRKDDFTGPLGDAVRQDLRLPMVGVPIVVEGSMWGFMVAAAAEPGRPIPADAEERLARFTELVATAVANATTSTELLTSRARVVSAADETRRRLERDLHDGIQQWLVALALRARTAAGLSAPGELAGQELSDLADDLVAVTDELREISRGIHPAILSDAGLDDALEALARRSTIRVDLDVSFQGRYDPTLEATVYYVAAESITNAVKHAQATTVTVRGGRSDGTIELEIRDDGVGGADPRRGTGLIGLKDRVDTLGGTISFASPAGAGTTIRVKLPAGPRDGEDPPVRRSDEAASAPASG